MPQPPAGWGNFQPSPGGGSGYGWGNGGYTTPSFGNGYTGNIPSYSPNNPEPGYNGFQKLPPSAPIPGGYFDQLTATMRSSQPGFEPQPYKMPL
jgi:hypothetical protein